METKSFVKDFASKIRGKYNHNIVTISMIALFVLVIIFVQLFGVKVNIGSAVYDDGKEYYIKQNIYQIIDTVISSDMTQEEAQKYVDKVNQTLVDKYGVSGFNTKIETPGNELNPGAFESLGEFGTLAAQLGKDASKINFLKYKLAYALAVSDPGHTAHKQSFDGSRIVAISGQLVLMVLPQIALFALSLIFLIYAVVALVKKKEFTKTKFALILLSVFSFINIFLFSIVSFLSMNWAGVLSIILVFLYVIAYAILRHALMEEREFSQTMFIHNIVLLAGGILALALYLMPLFKLTSEAGHSISLGWAFIMDYSLGEMAYMSAVMAYTLTEILTIALLMLPAVLLIVLIMLQINRFMAADYYHNEKNVYLIVTTIINALVFIVISALSASNGLFVTSQYYQVRLNYLLAILQLIVMGGLIAFTALYKVRPVKKEIIVK